MIVQVVLGLCCSQMSETILYDSTGCSRALLFTNVRDYRLYDCAGCSRALLFINVRLDCMTVQVF